MAWCGLIDQDGVGVDEAADGDAAPAGGDGDAEVYAPGLSADRTFLYKEEGDGTSEEGNIGSSVVAAGSTDNGGDGTAATTTTTTSLSSSGGDAKKQPQKAAVSEGKSGNGGATGTRAKAAAAAAAGGGPWPWSRGEGSGDTDGEGVDARGRGAGGKDKDSTRRQGGRGGSTKGKRKGGPVVLREDGMPVCRSRVI